MFSDKNAVSSKRVVGTFIIINLLSLFDIVLFLEKDISDNAVSIFFLFGTIAMVLWGYNTLLNIFKK
jgi:hypothetical protein